MDTGKLLLTIPEAAIRLGLGRSLVYRLVMAGEIPSIKLGRARRVPAPALEEFVGKRLEEAHSALARVPQEATCFTPWEEARCTQSIVGTDVN